MVQKELQKQQRFHIDPCNFFGANLNVATVLSVKFSIRRSTMQVFFVDSPPSTGNPPPPFTSRSPWLRPHARYTIYWEGGGGGLVQLILRDGGRRRERERERVITKWFYCCATKISTTPTSGPDMSQEAELSSSQTHIMCVELLSMSHTLSIRVVRKPVLRTFRSDLTCSLLLFVLKSFY